ETERWLSRDPIGEDRGLNLYAYCANDPLNCNDALGLSFFSALSNFVVGGVLGAAATYVVGVAVAVATVAASPVVVVAAAGVAVGVVAYGGYKLGKALYGVGTGEEA